MDVRAKMVSVKIYHDASRQNFDEAEKLLLRALELYEAGRAMLDRAAELCSEVATAMDAESASIASELYRATRPAVDAKPVK